MTGAKAVTATFTRVASVRGDFNLDGKPDLLWQHSGGTLYAWFMNGSTKVGGAYLSPMIVDPQWEVVGMADFDGDGDTDLLWQHKTLGTLYAWLMTGTTSTSGAYLSPSSVGPEWRVAAIADFNADAKPDILWQHKKTGTTYVYYMNGLTKTSGAYVGTQVPPEWEVAGAADMNADNKPDLLWRHAVTGQMYVWYMNGLTPSSGTYVSPHTVGTSWKIVAFADINLDGHPDIVWRNDTNGDVYLWLMNNAAQIQGMYFNPATVDASWALKQGK
jgi:hypothetical protein